MRRRFPLMWRLSLILLLILAVPATALAGLSQYLQRSIRTDMEERVDTTLDMAINMEESLVREGLADMRHVALAVATDPGVTAGVTSAQVPLDLHRFQRAFPQADMLLVVDTTGTVRSRASSDTTGDKVLLDGLVAYAISAGEAQAYPTLVGPNELQGEGPAIHQLVDMAILQTGGSTDPRVGSRVDTALALAGVAPIHTAGGELVGAVIAADILNRDFRIVDEVARWAPEGTPLKATIAMGGVRVTTNVRLLDPEGNQSEHRALGTVYSDAVMESLTAKGIHRGRAVVVGQWQRTIYRALDDYQGRMIAAPYVGIPEAYFATLGDGLTRSLQTVAAIGSAVVLASLLLAHWLTYRGAVVPLRRLTRQMATGAVAAGFANDEIGDLARAVQGLTERWNAAAAQMRNTAKQMGDTLEHLHHRPPVRPERPPELPAAADLRTGATGSLEHLRQLSEAIKALAEGVRSEERSIHYVGRVAQEIASGLEESRGTVESAVADVGQLTASARAALKQAGEFAAGLAMFRQALQGHPSLDLLRDPADSLAALLALSERVAGEVRTLVLIIQENQARLAFIREEMTRVSSVVQSTAAATHAAAHSAGQAIGWMEGMAANAVSVADEVLAARAGFAVAADANRQLQQWCGLIEEQIRQFRQTVEQMQEKA